MHTGEMSIDATERIFGLLSLLQTPRLWSGPELAERLNVTVRTLRRDIDRLRLLGYPVDSVPGRDGGYRLGAGKNMPPLVLDDDEAVAIAIGLRLGARTSLTGIGESSQRALAKIEQLLPDRLGRRIGAITTNLSTYDWGPDQTSIDVEVLATLAQGCRDCEEMRFDYRRADGEATERLVRPHRVVALGRRWYVAAWDVRRDDWRTFRLDRIGSVIPAGVRFDPLVVPGGDAATFVANSIENRPKPFGVTVTLHLDTETCRERWPSMADRIESAGRGLSSVSTFQDSVDQLVGFVMYAARIAPIEVDGPPELAERLSIANRRIALALDDSEHLPDHIDFEPTDA